LETEGPIILVRASLPSRSFSVGGRKFEYFEGMPAKVQVAVKSEPILVAMIPGLKVFFPHDD
jgi:membrane fusion protein (multidrug efflux system)